MLIAINGRIFPTTGLIKGAKTAEFLHRLLSEPTPKIPKMGPRGILNATVVPIRRNLDD